MISSFLVEELARLTERSTGMTLAYYFCDDKDEGRRTATAILRGLLLQLLRQQPKLFKHIQPDFDISGDFLFKNFHTLWKAFVSVVQDPEAGAIYCLIDALDECEEGSRYTFLTDFKKLFCPQQSGKAFVKFIVTSRPNNDIKESLTEESLSEESLSRVSPKIRNIQIDSGKVNADLSKFIDVKVDELSRQKRYSPNLKQTIKDALTVKAGGTFLYVSLVLDDLKRTKISSQVKRKLQTLPPDLDEVYKRILGQIDADCVEIARFILCWVVVARRPLTVEELAMARALGTDAWEGNTIPPQDLLDELKDGFECCEPLVYVDTDNDTINLVHQSAKEYLLDTYLQASANLSQYRVVTDMTNLLIFQICWRYLSLEEFDQGTVIIERDVDNKLHQRLFSESFLHSHCFLRYATQEWQEHALAASPALVADYRFKKDTLEKSPTLRDSWLLRAAKGGQEAVVRLLLENGAELDSKSQSGQTPLSWAAKKGHEAVVRLLLEKGAELDSKSESGQTPLLLAAENGHEEVVRLLLLKREMTEVNAKDKTGKMALHRAASKGHEAVVRLLLENGANIDAKVIAVRINAFEGTALHLAAREGHKAVVELLLEKGANIDAKVIVNAVHYIEGTALHLAAREGHKAVVQLLLEKGANVDTKVIADDGGDSDCGSFNSSDGGGGYSLEGTALHLAAKGGHKAVVQQLLEKGANVDAKAIMTVYNTLWEGMALRREKEADVDAKAIMKVDGHPFKGTALHLAAKEGHETVVKLLLEKGANVDAEAIIMMDGHPFEGTALHLAAKKEHEAVVKLLLEKGANVDAKARMKVDGHPVKGTALHLAAKEGHEAVVKLLLEKGANVDAKAIMKVDNDPFEGTALHLAVWTGHEAVVQQLLEKGVDVDSKDSLYGRTPLSWAAKNGHEAVVKLLIAKDGVVSNFKDNDGRTPLLWAARNGHDTVVKLLIAKDGVVPNFKDNDGRTPLLWAAAEGHETVVKLLLDNEADLDTEDNDGFTALQLAGFYLHDEVEQMLMEKGASTPKDFYGLQTLF
jgi:ankyrin repeat protein